MTGQQQQQQNQQQRRRNPRVVMINATTTSNNEEDNNRGRRRNNTTTATTRGFNLATMPFDNQQTVQDIAESTSWLKVYFIVAILIIGVNAFFSEKYWILSGIFFGIVAYVGVRFYQSILLKIGCIFFVGMVALRVYSVVVVFNNESTAENTSLADAGEETSYKFFNLAAGIIGVMIDVYFGYRYAVLIYVLDIEMDDEMLAYLKYAFPPTTCGCL